MLSVYPIDTFVEMQLLDEVVGAAEILPVMQEAQAEVSAVNGPAAMMLIERYVLCAANRLMP